MKYFQNRPFCRLFKNQSFEKGDFRTFDFLVVLFLLLASLSSSCGRGGGGCRCCCQSEIFSVQVLELCFPFVSSVDLVIRLETTIGDISHRPFSVASKDLMKTDKRIVLKKLVSMNNFEKI